MTNNFSSSPKEAPKYKQGDDVLITFVYGTSEPAKVKETPVALYSEWYYTLELDNGQTTFSYEVNLEPLIKLDINNSSIKLCVHSWKKYDGLIDSYDFCTKCDEKGNRI